MPSASAYLSPTTETRLPTRASSFASTAEVFYTAQNTPAVSRHPSQLDLTDISSRLQKNKSKPSNLSHLALSTISDATFSTSSSTPTNQSTPIRHSASPPDPAGSLGDLVAQPDPISPGSTTSTISTSSPESFAPIQRIRSLANFKLYLSPSRLAQVDLLAEPDIRDLRPAFVQRRRTLRPAILEANGFALATRARRPPLRLLGAPGEQEDARCYSDRLVRHHAEELQKLDHLAVGLMHSPGGEVVNGPGTISQIRTPDETPRPTRTSNTDRHD